MASPSSVESFCFVMTTTASDSSKLLATDDDDVAVASSSIVANRREKLGTTRGSCCCCCTGRICLKAAGAATKEPEDVWTGDRGAKAKQVVVVAVKNVTTKRPVAASGVLENIILVSFGGYWFFSCLLACLLVRPWMIRDSSDV
jgi:hypothetical protein